jgi:microcystin-dependent protein
LDWEDISGNEDIYGSPVQGLSQIKITVNTTTSYSSPIESYSINVNGKRYTSTPVTTEVLTVSGSYPISVTVTDKRGRVGTASSTSNVQAYTPPKITSLSVHRSTNMGMEDEQGEYAKVNFTAVVSSMSKKNTCEYVVKYKKSAETSWTSIPQTIYTNSNYAPTASVVFAADGNSSYDVMVEATDRHGTASRSTSVSTAFTLMNWHPSGTGMAFGKVAERENTMEIALDVEFLGAVKGAIFDAIYPVGSIYLAFNHTNPSTLFGGTWERIENRFLWATTDGGIIGNLGGESTHTLTESEMPSHTHSLIRPQWYQGDGTTESTVYTTSTGSIYGSTASTTPSYRTVKGVKGIEATGGGKAHNNMPPYIQVSAWHRTA